MSNPIYLSVFKTNEINGNQHWLLEELPEILSVCLFIDVRLCITCTEPSLYSPIKMPMLEKKVANASSLAEMQSAVVKRFFTKEKDACSSSTISEVNLKMNFQVIFVSGWCITLTPTVDKDLESIAGSSQEFENKSEADPHNETVANSRYIMKDS